MTQLPAVAALEVVIGIQANDTDSDGELIVTRALANELGARGIPPRPFISSASDENQPRWFKQFAIGNQLALVGNGDADLGFQYAGLIAVADIQRKIVAIKSPPNAPQTIEAKGSSNPLIDTGQMRQSIRYLIRREGATS